MPKRKDIEEKKIDPKVKDILTLLGAGVFITASMLMPGVAVVAQQYLEKKQQEEKNEWKKFNTWRLKAMLKKMHQQKIVEIGEENDMQVIKLSERGRKKFLKFEIEKMQLVERKWDRKWRLIVYDIQIAKQSERRLFHKTLKRMKFLQLQRSVYITPYPCQREIEYLRQVCNIGREVLILTVAGIENEAVYREYFGL